MALFVAGVIERAVAQGKHEACASIIDALGDLELLKLYVDGLARKHYTRGQVYRSVLVEKIPDGRGALAEFSFKW